MNTNLRRINTADKDNFINYYNKISGAIKITNNFKLKKKL